MPFARPPLFLFALAALASAFAVPEAEGLNPLLGALYPALVVAGVMLGAWHGGLQIGIQAAIVGALGGNLLAFSQTGSLGASLAQFGVFMLVALVVNSWREAGRRTADARVAAVPPTPSNGYRPLLEDVSDAILVTDERGRCLDANRAMSALTGYEPAELQRLHAARVVGPCDRWTDDDRLRFSRVGHWRGPLRVRRRDGAVLKVQARLMLLELPSGVLYLTAIGSGRPEVVESSAAPTEAAPPA